MKKNTRSADESLVCGRKVQRDHSGGQGHCWRAVSGDDLPANIREEIAAEILDGGHETHSGYRATNGQVYRW